MTVLFVIVAVVSIVRQKPSDIDKEEHSTVDNVKLSNIYNRNQNSINGSAS